MIIDLAQRRGHASVALILDNLDRQVPGIGDGWEDTESSHGTDVRGDVEDTRFPVETSSTVFGKLVETVDVTRSASEVDVEVGAIGIVHLPLSHRFVTMRAHVPSATRRSSTARRRIGVVAIGTVDCFRGHIIVVIVLIAQGGHGRVDGDTAEDFRRRFKAWIIVGIGDNLSDGSRNHLRHGCMRHIYTQRSTLADARAGFNQPYRS